MIGLKLKVDYTDMGRLSREFTAVLVELNTKHPIPDEVEWSVLKTLRHMFTTTTNHHQYQVRGRVGGKSPQRRSVSEQEHIGEIPVPV